MDKHVIWTTPAAEDLKEVHDYIARDSPSSAAEISRRIVAGVDDLSRFPGMGRGVPELGRSTLREVIIPPYRVIYRVDEQAVVVLGVVHGARRLKVALRGRKL